MLHGTMRISTSRMLLFLLLLCCLVHTTTPQNTTNLYAGCKGVAHDWVPECWSATYAQISFGGDRTLYFIPYTSKWVQHCCC
jgi:hypothetical protein